MEIIHFNQRNREESIAIEYNKFICIYTLKCKNDCSTGTQRAILNNVFQLNSLKTISKKIAYFIVEMSNR